MNDIIIIRITMRIWKISHCYHFVLHLPRQLARLISILALFLFLSGCAPSLFSIQAPAHEIPVSATLDSTSARATTVPVPLLSKEPESAVEINRPATQAFGTVETRANSTSPVVLPSSTPTPTRTRLPLQTSDLLYLSTSETGSSRLMRWDHFTGYSSLLAENVELFLTSSNGKTILLLRPHHVSGNGQALYDLDRLNYETMQTSSVLKQINYPYWLSLSPDGNWFAYQEMAQGGTIYARHLETPTQYVELGECNPGENSALYSKLLCAQLAWSPDGRQVIWSDTEGLWSSFPLQPQAQHIHQPVVEVSDPKGNLTKIPVMLHNISWSPVGRFIRVQITPSLQGVQWQGVVDTRLGHLEDIPESSEYTAQQVSINWTKTGSLVVAHGGNGSSPFVKIWDVLATNSDLVVLKRTYELGLDRLSIEFPTSTVVSTHELKPLHLTWFFEFDENTFFLGLTFSGSEYQSNSNTSPMLFSLNLRDGNPRKMIELPYDVSEVFWAPDGSGALITGEHDQFLFFSLKNFSLSNVQSGISTGAHSFVWMPPVQRR